jgi:hypothetical protein
MKYQKSKLRILNYIYYILSSRECLLWLIGGWIFYYVMSAVWTEQAFAGFVNGIEKNIFIQIPYILFLVVGLLNLARSSREIIKRGKFQYILWLMLPLGLILFFSAFFLSIYNREVGQRIVEEGDVIKPPWVSEEYRLARIVPGLRPNIRDSESEIGIFAHEPKLELIDRTSGRYSVGAFPPDKINGTYYHILNFGIAPGIRFFRGDRILNEGYMPLRILTFGSSDFFEIAPLPYRFLVSMEPEKTFLKGDAISSQYNLERPVYRIRVFKGDEMIHEGDSRVRINFDNYSLAFFQPSYWILLEAVKDPAVPLMRLSLLLIALGIPLSLLNLFVGRSRGP